MDMGYVFFMAEADGDLPTRAGRINAVIKELKEYPYSEIPFSEYERILEEHDLSYEKLTEREKRLIDASI